MQLLAFVEALGGLGEVGGGAGDDGVEDAGVLEGHGDVEGCEDVGGRLGDGDAGDEAVYVVGQQVAFQGGVLGGELAVEAVGQRRVHVAGSLRDGSCGRRRRRQRRRQRGSHIVRGDQGAACCGLGSGRLLLLLLLLLVTAMLVIVGLGVQITAVIVGGAPLAGPLALDVDTDTGATYRPLGVAALAAGATGETSVAAARGEAPLPLFGDAGAACLIREGPVCLVVRSRHECGAVVAGGGGGDDVDIRMACVGRAGDMCVWGGGRDAAGFKGQANGVGEGSIGEGEVQVELWQHSRVSLNVEQPVQLGEIHGGGVGGAW